MENKSVQKVEFKEHVRKRPGMYIGSTDSAGLGRFLLDILTESLNVLNQGKTSLRMKILSDFKIEVEIINAANLTLLMDAMNEDLPNQSYLSFSILKVLSVEFSIEELPGKKVKLCFTLDDSIFKESIDYYDMSERMKQFVMLNRNVEILLTDKRRKYLVQNYYHFPKGVKYIFELETKKFLSASEFKVEFDGEINGLSYQIFLGYKSAWDPNAVVHSFANNENTKYGGDLVLGVFDGLIDACRQYIKENKMINHSFKSKKLINGLILVAAVRGKDFDFSGSTKECLSDEQVRKDTRKLIKGKLLDFMRNNKELANKFFVRFDKTNIGNKMFEIVGPGLL